MKHNASEKSGREIKSEPVPNQDRDTKVRLGDAVSPWPAKPKARLGDAVMPWHGKRGA